MSYYSEEPEPERCGGCGDPMGCTDNEECREKQAAWADAREAQAVATPARVELEYRLDAARLTGWHMGAD